LAGVWGFLKTLKLENFKPLSLSVLGVLGGKYLQESRASSKPENLKTPKRQNS
jgi:hypothetical protein